eukprot:TRINITY_DN51555_c0_g1_i1.p1 TRINITY_DN51555_c0_g1~~TRINITY_DN51555_c0_g1_i1.p1  ORF type:complete len:312 (-),score=75.23 TRINITY_DN51555_c0_g1_i1:88-1023(-)
MMVNPFGKLAAAAGAASLGCWYLSRPRPVAIEGRVVLITGAAGGVGRLCALGFAQQGCKLVLWDLNEEGLQETKEAVLRVAPRCAIWTQRVDIGDREAIYRAAEETQELVAPDFVSVLVNNAGIMSGRSFLETEDDKAEAVFRVNTLAHLWTCKAFVPAMLRAKLGHVVAVASIAGLIAAPGMVDYAASKFAVIGFMEGLRKELKLESTNSVHTSVICPAAIKTDLFKDFDQPFFAALDPQHVANEIVDAVRYRVEKLVLPRSADPALFNALLPPAVSDRLWRVLGHGGMMTKVDRSHAEKTLKLMARSKL